MRKFFKGNVHLLKKTVLILFLGLCAIYSAPSFAAQSIQKSPLDSSLDLEYPHKAFSLRSGEAKPEETPFQTVPAKDTEDWQFHKSFNLSTLYDSNLFGSRIDPKDDLLYIYSPAIGFTKRNDKSYCEIFYDLVYTDYVENEHLSRLGHVITTKILHEKDKWKFSLENSFRPDSPYNIGERTELRLKEASETTSTSDVASASLSYQLSPKWTLTYTQRYFIYYFHRETNTPFSAQAHVFNPRVSYKITPTTSVYASYSFRTVDFYKDGDFASKQHTPRAGIVSQISLKTQLGLSAGYAWRDYSRDPQEKDHEGIVLRGELTHQITPQLSGRLWALRNLDENFDTSLTLSPNEDAEFYGVDFSWTLSEALLFNAGGSIGFNSREGLVTVEDPENSALTFTREIENEFYAWDVHLDWKPNSNWAVLLGYKYFTADSSFKNFQYDDHKVIGSARVSF